jgi:hypothetical protein
VKLPNINTHPIAENSPNLATLLGTYMPAFGFGEIFNCMIMSR